MEPNTTTAHVAAPGWTVWQPPERDSEDHKLVGRPVTAWLVRQGHCVAGVPWIDLCPVTDNGPEHPFFIGLPDGSRVAWALFEWDSVEECLSVVADPKDRAELRDFLDSKREDPLQQVLPL